MSIAKRQRQEEPELKRRNLNKRPDMTSHDQLIMLLHLGASIEHALMVQYLYAAYSLGGEQVPQKHHKMIKEWQETILAVAREEMGHLLTVQNVLTLLGAGVNLNRQNFPWDIAYYPFPFVLEPFTRGALACYVYAEMPIEEQFPEREEVKKLAFAHAQKNGGKSGVQLHPVGEIYNQIIELLNKTESIPDSSFHELSINVQASWDDWGRGYRPDPQPLDDEGNLLPVSPKAHADAQYRAHVLIEQVATRTQALAALNEVSVQGEGPHGTKTEGEWSHFKRFIKMFREFETIKDEPWSPSRPVPTNPTTVVDTDCRATYIESSHSRDWAELFNVRYRNLLNLLMHTFQAARVSRADQPSVRAVLMHRVFCEMYNLKTLAGILVQLPLRDGGHPDILPEAMPRAGAPFEMPYTLSLPPDPADIWLTHLDVLGSSKALCLEILGKNPRPEDRAYIQTLLDLDEVTRKSIECILDGLGVRARYAR